MIDKQVRVSGILYGEASTAGRNFQFCGVIQKSNEKTVWYKDLKGEERMLRLHNVACVCDTEDEARYINAIIDRITAEHKKYDNILNRLQNGELAP